MPKPVVALVGRPNVGKSTLFNRLAGERLAIVDDIPGTTRDRLAAETEWNDVNFNIIDTGGIDPTHGGKTPLSVGSADFIQEIREQALVAVNEADAVLFITDGSEGVKVLTGMLRSAFPDFKATIDDILTEGDKVVIRMTWTGTQKGEFMGVPATGKRVSFGVIDIIRIANGKVVEHWGQMDSMSLMQQLGAIPAPSAG